MKGFWEEVSCRVEWPERFLLRSVCRMLWRINDLKNWYKPGVILYHAPHSYVLACLQFHDLISPKCFRRNLDSWYCYLDSFLCPSTTLEQIYVFASRISNPLNFRPRCTLKQRIQFISEQLGEDLLRYMVYAGLIDESSWIRNREYFRNV